MRAAAVASTVCLLAACGGESSPTGPGSPREPASLREGAYELRFARGATNTEGAGYVACLSMTVDGARSPDSETSLFMNLTRRGDGWALSMPNAAGANSGSLTVTLARAPVESMAYPAGSPVNGTARGIAIDGQGQTVQITADDGEGDALLVGAAVQDWGHGDLLGKLTVSIGAASVSCTPMTWALTRR